MVTNCPVCGKKFHVQYPHLWVYREDGVHICTSKCLRKIRREKEEKMAEELKNIEEPTPKKRGRKPKAKEKAPTPSFEDVKKSIMEIPQIKVDGPIRIEAEEPEKVEVLPVSMDAIPADGPLMRGGMEYRVTGIQTEIGDFQYYPRNKYLDWIPSACPEEVVSMNVEEWLQLLSDLPKIMGVLGVKV
jgi:hypothetical protein